MSLPHVNVPAVCIDDDIYLSLPTIVDGHGASKVLVPTLGVSDIADKEMAELEHSANTLLSVIRGVNMPLRRHDNFDDSIIYTAL